MVKISLKEIKLIGLALEKKTTNQNGQSAIDCGSHWQKFETGNYAEQIPTKTSKEIFAVYHDYDGDHTAPYAYFIGCRVDNIEQIPPGMTSLSIPESEYVKIVAKGIMPDCVANAWKQIWLGNIKRAYKADFEIYDERSKDWSNAEVDIYVSVRP
jgi:predicted transcriptional regulator YdeE